MQKTQRKLNCLFVTISSLLPFNSLRIEQHLNVIMSSNKTDQFKKTNFRLNQNLKDMTIMSPFIFPSFQLSFSRPLKLICTVKSKTRNQKKKKIKNKKLETRENIKNLYVVLNSKNHPVKNDSSSPIKRKKQIPFE